MSLPAVLLRRLTALSLLSVLLLVGVPPLAQGVQARSAPGRSIAAYLPGASMPPRAGRGQARRRPGLPVRMMAVDHADHRLQYRVMGELVQRATDGGRGWTTILTPGGSGRSGGCSAARYRHVNALVVSGLLPGTLFVAAAGQPGGVPRTRHTGACAAATGGLFVLRPDGHGGLRRTGSLAAGLPYAQDAQGRTPRAYALRALVPDPTDPAVLYADATLAAPAGPASPPTGLYRSSNGGGSLRPAPAGLAPPRPGPGPALQAAAVGSRGAGGPGGTAGAGGLDVREGGNPHELPLAPGRGGFRHASLRLGGAVLAAGPRGRVGSGQRILTLKPW